MFTRILLILMMLSAFSMGQTQRRQRIAAGDPLAKVYKLLGTPVIEFPLKGKLVQEYKQCTITSRKGVVLSAIYKESAKPIEKPIEKKSAPSIHDLKILALKGNAEAQYTLAFCFQSGQIVEKDQDKAIGWYTKAALQGHMPSQHNLGFVYMTGQGVEKDYAEAYAWALLAAANDNDSLLTSLIHKLSEKQKRAGEIRAENILAEQRAKQADVKQEDPLETSTAG